MSEHLTELMFKPEMIPHANWSYSLFAIMILLVLVFWGIYYKKTHAVSGKLNILEARSMHSKGYIYLVDYEGKQFLLADNHQALSWLALNKQDDKHV